MAAAFETVVTPRAHDPGDGFDVLPEGRRD